MQRELRFYNSVPSPSPETQTASRESFALNVSRADKSLEEIARFRYDIYIREMQLPLPGVDHDLGLLADSLDLLATHITACQDGQLVGTVRLNFNMVPSSLKTALEIDNLPRPFVYCSRLCIVNSCRGSALVNQLTRASFDIFHQMNAQVAICHCYPHLLKLYKRSGFEPYAKPFTLQGLESLGPQIPLICNLDKQLRPKAA